jgi:hypothetical protein
MTKMGLWRYDAITGMWKLERNCEKETASDWLAVFKKDEPSVVFILSRKKPRNPPPHLDR